MRESAYRYQTLAIGLLLAMPAPVSIAQDEDREVALPFVSLVQPPSVPKLKPKPLSDERRREIEKLIRQLSNATRKDIDLNLSYGSDFVPVGHFGSFGSWTGKPVEGISESVKRLIEIGPDSIPFLLEALDDSTRTEIVVKCVERSMNGGMVFDVWTRGNPVNYSEQRILQLDRHGFSPSARPKDEFFLPEDMESYRVKVGDVAYAILGHIVGRRYICLTSPHVKSRGVIVISPVQSKKLRQQIRDIWETENPKQRLLESLLIDFSTRGILQWDSLDFWDVGNGFQIEAVKRLLYYYPKIAAPLIAERIQGLHAGGDFMEDSVQNGIRSDNLVDSIAWSDNLEVKRALAKLARIAIDPGLEEALDRAGIRKP
ncbi:MAG: hypothetical protein AAF483_19225 [Planctomycetota bacterium]